MANSIQFDLLTLAQSLIQGRGLLLIDGVTSLSSSKVILQAVPSNLEAELPDNPPVYPYILVAPFLPETVDPMAGRNIRDQVIYQIVVAILASKADFQSPNSIASSLAAYLYWRQSLRQLFHNSQQPNGTTTVVNGHSYGPGTLAEWIYVQPLAVVDREAWLNRKLFASAMLLQCNALEPRG